MRIVWDRDAGVATVGDRRFDITNRVRNEIDPTAVRRLHDPTEVRRAIVNGEWADPYMPRKFPKGEWWIIGVEDTDVPDFAPIKIRTNAHQLVRAWALDANGGYDHPIDKLIDDSGYHLHWSALSRSTLGCGRVGRNDDSQIRDLAALVRAAFSLKETVILEVV